MARALELKLVHEGFDASIASNGTEAIEYLKANKTDLILLDLIMPVMDGFSVLQHMKEKNITTPVMVLSNLGQEEDEKRARASGAKDFFIKSNTPLADIVARVKSYLHQ